MWFWGCGPMYVMQRRFSGLSGTANFYVAVTVLSVTCSVTSTDEETDSLPLCRAGTYLSQSPPEKCVACKGGTTFMDRPNREHACYPCTKCESLMVELTPCSVTADARCECLEGYFKNIEGKCSPKSISPVASTPISYVNGKPDVGSSTSTDETEYRLDVVIGLIASVVVLFVLKIVIDYAWCCYQQKRTRACKMGCRPMDHKDKEKGAFHSKQSRCHEQPGQVADEQEKLVDPTPNPKVDSPERHLATITSAHGANGHYLIGPYVPALIGSSSCVGGIQAGGEQSVQSKKAERGSYAVAMREEADDKCEPSETQRRPNVLNNSKAGFTSTSV